MQAVIQTTLHCNYQTVNYVCANKTLKGLLLLLTYINYTEIFFHQHSQIGILTLQGRKQSDDQSLVQNNSSINLCSLIINTQI